MTTPNTSKLQRSGTRYRVVQWATGNVGARALRRTIEHPGLELVGVYVHSPDKVGCDAGTLAGLVGTGMAEPAIAELGVRATGSVDDIVAQRPDCVLYMPHEMDYDEVARLLSSGANVITTRTEFQNPATMDPAIRDRIERACQAGGTSIHGTGSSPGFISEALPIVLTSIQRRLDRFTIHEFADNTTRNSPEMLFGPMGFGAKPETGPNPAILAHMKDAFGGTLSLLAEAVGLPLDSVEVRGSLGIARRDVHIAAGIVPAGTVAATRTVVSGLRAGHELMRFVATWYVSSEVDTPGDEDWHFCKSGWHLLVEGDCPLDIAITYPVAPEDYAEMTPGLTANRPVNMVPYVCEAPAGIRTTMDLPQVIASFS